MIFNKTESIEREIVSLSRNLSIKNVVILSHKGSDNKKLGSIYSKSYASKKYSNYSNLEKIVVKESDFLVFSYFEKNSNSEILSDELYFSYNNLYTLFNAFKTMNDILIEPENKIWKERDGELFLSKKFKDVHSSVTLNSQGGKKKLIIRFDIGEDKEGKLFPSVSIIIGKEECCAYVGVQEFINFTYFLKNFSLELNSIGLYNTAMIHDLYTNGSSNSPSTPSQKSVGRSSSYNSKESRRRIYEEDEVDETTAANVFNDEEDEKEDSPEPPKSKSKKNKKSKSKKSSKSKEDAILSKLDDDDDYSDDDDSVAF